MAALTLGSNSIRLIPSLQTHIHPKIKMKQERNLKRRKGKPSSSSSQSSALAIDKINTLPDPILHDIFNLLPTKSVARTAVLSKRFNALWLTYPIMDFNEYDHCRKKYTDKLLNRMQRTYETHDFSFLEKLKIRAREPVKKVFNENLSLEVERFILRSVYADTLKEVQLQFPISKNPPTVADLSNLDMFHRRFYLLPEISLLFSFCKSLKFLKLTGCRFEGNIDNGIILPFLKELILKYCAMPDDNFISKFIDGCPQLEKLSFKFILPGRKIQFSSSKLKNLVLGCYDSTTTYQIVTPNLQSLKITGTHWKRTLNEGLWFQPQHMISAPNLETLSSKHMLLNNEGINRALSAFKSLKELELLCSVFTDEPNFESRNIEKLEMLNCIFHDVNLFISSSNLPRAKLVYLFSCTGLRNLTLHSRGLVFKVQACQAFREFRRINLD